MHDSAPVKRSEKFTSISAIANSGALYPSSRLLARAKSTIGDTAVPLMGEPAGMGK